MLQNVRILGHETSMMPNDQPFKNLIIGINFTNKAGNLQLGGAGLAQSQLNQLQNQIDSNTHITIFAHGENERGWSGKVYHSVHLFTLISLQDGTTYSPGNGHETSLALEILEKQSSTPLSFELESCHSNTAQSDLSALKIGSTLITTVKAEYTSIRMVSLEFDLPGYHALERFLFYMTKASQEMIFGQRLEDDANGKPVFFRYTYQPFSSKPKSLEEEAAFIIKSQNDFIKACELNHACGEFRHIPDPTNTEQVKDSLTWHLHHLLRNNALSEGEALLDLLDLHGQDGKTLLNFAKLDENHGAEQILRSHGAHDQESSWCFFC